MLISSIGVCEVFFPQHCNEDTVGKRLPVGMNSVRYNSEVNLYAEHCSPDYGLSAVC